MASRSPEDLPQHTRLPSGYFTELSGSLFRLNHLAFEDALFQIPPPAVFSREMSTESDTMGLWTEVGSNATNGLWQVTSYTVEISEYEPYEPNPDYTVYFTKYLILDLLKRRCHFGRSASLYGGDNITVELDLSRQATVGRRKPGELAWRQLRRSTENVFTNDELQYFKEKIAQHTLHLEHAD